MKKSIFRTICALLVLCLNLAVPIAQADEGLSNSVTSQVYDTVKRGSQFLLGIEQKRKHSEEELALVRDNIGILEKKLSESTFRVNTLSEQLANLDSQIKDNNTKILAMQVLAAEYKNSIANLETDAAQKEELLNSHLADLLDALRILYIQQGGLIDTETQTTDALALLAQGDASRLLDNERYLSFIEQTATTLFAQVVKEHAELDKTKTYIQNKKESLQRLDRVVTSEQQSLIATRTSQQRLLEETRGQQSLYESLLELSRKDVVNVSADITRLKENFEFFEEKLKAMQNGIPSESLNLGALFDDDELFASELQGMAPLAWPVSPALGISAFFHDAGYRAAMGLQHDAIDIRAPQETKIHAPADGIVTKVADNGLAYSYIIIAHADKVVTLFGHVSQILVSEGEVVRQGQIIGLSGGLPGSKGAGWLTTGPHLHFEVFKNFQHVDPLDYLPLELVPLASLPEKYLKRLTE